MSTATPRAHEPELFGTVVSPNTAAQWFGCRTRRNLGRETIVQPAARFVTGANIAPKRRNAGTAIAGGIAQCDRLRAPLASE